MKINAIVFDVGNVLFKYDPKLILRGLLPQSKHHKLYLDHLFNHDLWQTLDRGDITQDAAIAQLSEELGKNHKDAIETCITYFVDHLTPITQSIDCFNHYASRFPIYILSNFQDQPFSRLETLHPFLKNRKDAIVSARVGYKKPEPPIYELLIKTVGLDPEEILFIDDMEENITSAKIMGIQTIHFNPELALSAEIEKAL